MSAQATWHTRAINRTHLSARLAGCLGMLAVGVTGPSMVHAQNDASDTSQSIEEIIVTGSLIRSPNQESASPIVSTPMSDLETNGDTSLINVLNQLPQFNATSGVQSGGQGTGGRVTINLRGLGSNRNLVLLDGRRLPLSDIAGNVDINQVPAAAIGRVDVITGGASAVYGSDAMSGVVNFLTVPYFDGVNFDLQYGNSSRNDVQQEAASLAFGTTSDDGKGKVLVAFGYTDREGLSGSDRSFFDYVTPSSYLGTSTFVPSATNLPDPGVVDGLFSSYGYNGVGNTVNLGFNDDGSLFVQNGAQNYKGPTEGLYAVLGGNVRMPVGRQAILVNPIDQKSAFTKFEYEFTPNLTAYGQFMYVNSDVYTESGGSLTQFGSLTTVPVTNPFVPADLQTILASRMDPSAPFTWNGRYVGVHYKGWDEIYDTSQYVAGLKGDLPFGDWYYDIYASGDHTNHNQANRHAVLKSRVQNLLNAPDGGDSICSGGLNIFGIANTTSLSEDCQNYISTTAHSQEKLEQTIVQGTIQGSLFELPAGPVRAALQADQRRNTYEYTPDTSLAAQDIEAVIASAPADGKIDVTEFAAQVEIPLLSDVALANSLTLGLAYRYSDYSTSGGVNAYEGDLKWRPVSSTLLRTSYQRAVRAPSIGELFSAAQGVQVAFGTPPGSLGDPCDIRSTARTGSGGSSVRQLCIDQGIPLSVIDSYIFPTTATAGVQSGNPGLDPETADTYNFGVQWSSESDSAWMSGMTLSVDYYNIDIQEVISVVPGLTTLSKCYNLDGSNPGYAAGYEFCQLLERDSNGLLSLIRTPYLNLGSLSTDGVDLQFSWAPSLSVFGMNSDASLYLDAYINYTNSFEIETVPGSGVQDYVNTISVGNSHPEWKAMTTIGYRGDALNVGVRWRYLGAMDDVTSVTTPQTPSPGTPSYNTYDLFGTFNVGDHWQFRAGITNLSDELSVMVSSSQNSTDTSVFNPIGRSYYLGLSYSM